ncbi:MAG: hypothetical protein ACRDQ5_01675 [Sciscionella sp.]
MFANYQPVFLLGLAAILLLITIGVVLPAVWSRSPERRRAAARVLCQLLGSGSKKDPR